MQLLDKYRNISRIFGQKEDEQIIEELIELVAGCKENMGRDKEAKKSKFGEAEFRQMITAKPLDLSGYELSDGIVKHREDIPGFWSLLAEEEKGRFTIFELNVILFLISEQFNKYQKKDKQKIIRFIDQMVREKKMEDSYRSIKV